MKDGAGTLCNWLYVDVQIVHWNQFILLGFVNVVEQCKWGFVHVTTACNLRSFHKPLNKWFPPLVAFSNHNSCVWKFAFILRKRFTHFCSAAVAADIRCILVHQNLIARGLLHHLQVHSEAVCSLARRETPLWYMNNSQKVIVLATLFAILHQLAKTPFSWATTRTCILIINGAKLLGNTLATVVQRWCYKPRAHPLSNVMLKGNWEVLSRSDCCVGWWSLPPRMARDLDVRLVGWLVRMGTGWYAGKDWEFTDVEARRVVKVIGVTGCFDIRCSCSRKIHIPHILTTSTTLTSSPDPQNLHLLTINNRNYQIGPGTPMIGRPNSMMAHPFVPICVRCIMKAFFIQTHLYETCTYVCAHVCFRSFTPTTITQA